MVKSSLEPRPSSAPNLRPSGRSFSRRSSSFKGLGSRLGKKWLSCRVILSAEIKLQQGTSFLFFFFFFTAIACG